VLESDVPVLDERILTEVLETTGDDIAFVRELVETYLADTPTQLAAMTTALESDDADALVRPAHTLKSSSATVGVMRLSSVARELEMAGRSGSLEAASRARLEVAHTEWQAAADAIGAWLERAPRE
jgi:HPt (histidine-containing phosphotransfer) domain-containing protein